MKKINQKLIISGVGILAVFYLYFSFLFLPASKKIKVLKKEYESSKLVLEDVKQKVAILPVLEKDSFKLKKELYYTIKRLPVSEDLPGLLKVISNIAVDSGINITTFEPLKQIQKDFYTDIPFKISATSSYHKIGIFLNELSYQSRLIIASDIQLVAISSTEGVTVSATIFLNSYVTKQAAEILKYDMKDERIESFRSNGFSVKPFYLYDRRDKRDPFKPLSIVELASKSTSVAINTLKLTGIISFTKLKTAVLEDVNASKYTLTDGVLYANDMSIISDVTGTIKKDMVILRQIDKDTKKLKTVVLKLKKEEE